MALTTALLLLAAVAFAGEPSAPESNAEAAAEAAADTSAAQPTGTEATAKVTDDKPFKPPAGYKPKRINGEMVYCMKTVVLGSKFPVTDCRNEAQLRDMERTKRAMRDDLNRNRACAGSSCSAN